MPAGLTFTDGTGAATLSNGRVSPADRLGNFVPDADPVGEHEVTLAGVTHEFKFRTDYLASFEVALLSSLTLAVALRLKLWLLAGNTVTLTTNDTNATTYTCRLAPGTVPQVQLVDRRHLSRGYAFQVALLNTAAAPILCDY